MHRISEELIARLADIPGSAIKEARKKIRPPMSQKRLGDAILPRTTQQTIQKLEKYRPGEDDQENIVKGGVLKLRVCLFLGLLQLDGDDMTKSGHAAMAQEVQEGIEYLPLFKPRLAEGGSMSVRTKTPERVERPPHITEKKARALEMVGDTMYPEYRDGATLFVNPDIQAQINMGCVFLNQNRTLIKVLTFEGYTDKVWLAQQWNPSAAIELSRAEWPYCEPIEGTHAPHKRGIHK